MAASGNVGAGGGAAHVCGEVVLAAQVSGRGLVSRVCGVAYTAVLAQGCGTLAGKCDAKRDGEGGEEKGRQGAAAAARGGGARATSVTHADFAPKDG